MSNDQKRGPGRPRKEEDAAPEVLREPVQDAGNRMLEQQEAAEAERKANQAVYEANERAKAEDAAKVERARQEAAEAAAKEAEGEKNAYKGETAEVLIVRKYVPHYIPDADGDLVPQFEENQQTIAPGTTIRLPKKEAARAVQLGIASITENSFDG